MLGKNYGLCHFGWMVWQIRFIKAMGKSPYDSMGVYDNWLILYGFDLENRGKLQGTVNMSIPDWKHDISFNNYMTSFRGTSTYQQKQLQETIWNKQAEHMFSHTCFGMWPFVWQITPWHIVFIEWGRQKIIKTRGTRGLQLSGALYSMVNLYSPHVIEKNTTSNDTGCFFPECFLVENSSIPITQQWFYPSPFRSKTPREIAPEAGPSYKDWSPQVGTKSPSPTCLKG